MLSRSRVRRCDGEGESGCEETIDERGERRGRLDTGGSEVELERDDEGRVMLSRRAWNLRLLVARAVGIVLVSGGNGGIG